MLMINNDYFELKLYLNILLKKIYIYIYLNNSEKNNNFLSKNNYRNVKKNYNFKKNIKKNKNVLIK